MTRLHSHLLSRRELFQALGLYALGSPFARLAYSQAAPACIPAEGFYTWGNQPIFLSGSRYLAYTSRSCWSIERAVAKPGIFRFELRTGDSTPEDQATNNISERAEFNQKAFLDQHRDIALRFRMMVERGPKTSGDWTIITQMHHTPDPGDANAGPPFAQALRRDDLFVISTQSYSETPLIRKPPRIDHFQRPNFERGTWHEFEYQIRFSPDSDGKLYCRMNGEVVVDYIGSLGYRNSRGPYFKFGIYRQPVSEPIAVQYSDISLEYVGGR